MSRRRKYNLKSTNLLENCFSLVTVTLVFAASMVSCSKLFNLLLTLMRLIRNSLRSSTFMIPSSTGWVQSMLKVNVDFFFEAFLDFYRINITNIIF